MAVELYDDHEQGERVKQWLKDNGGGILLGLALAAGGVFGFRYWQDNQQQQAYQASGYYRVVTDQLAELAAAADAQNETSEDAPDNAGETAMLEALAALQNDHSGNLYAALATLQYADHNLRNDDVQGAAQQYQFVIDNSGNQQMRSLAALRLARVQLGMDDAQAALQTLESLPAATNHAGLAARIRGEAYLAMNDREQALSAFEEAEQELGGSPDRMLELRLADLRDVDIDKLLEDAPAAQAPPVFNETSSRPAEIISTPTISADGEPVQLRIPEAGEAPQSADSGTPGITDADGDQ